MLTSSVSLLSAVLVSAAVALAAYRLRALSVQGALAATAVGAAALHASLGWGLYLIAWFVCATALSKTGSGIKARRLAGIVQKGGSRDASQVLANGGVFSAAALAIILAPSCDLLSACGRIVAVAAAGSLAAAGADTWSTEIGTLWGGAPWSVRTGRRVAAGVSGAITLHGTVGLVVGASVLAAVAASLHVVQFQVQPVVAVATGGVLGAAADTLLGAWVQERRWCSTCNRETEQPLHHCGTITTVRGGVRGVTNDVVNALCSMVGAIGAAVVVLL